MRREISTYKTSLSSGAQESGIVTIRTKGRAVSSKLLKIEKNGGTALLTLNRPEVLNALSRELLLALLSELDRIKDDNSIRGILITGSGDRAFSAGADIGYLHSATPLQVRELAALAVSVTNRIEHLGKPSIALINGFALGGGLELAEACMLRIAASTAMMGHPEVKIGAVAGWGGTTRLPRLVGKGRAAELLLTGRLITAEHALEISLVNAVFDPEKIRIEGERLMSEILSHPPASVKFTWEALHRGLDLSTDESARLGADYFGLIASTDEFRAATGAFLRRKKPKRTARS